MSIHNQSKDDIKQRNNVMSTGLSGSQADEWLEKYSIKQAKLINPSGQFNPELINEYLFFYKKICMYDPRVLAFQVSGKVSNNVLVLDGMVSLEQQLLALIKVFEKISGLKVESNIIVLPDSRLGTDRYGIVSNMVAPLFSGPDDREEKLTEALLGDPLIILFMSSEKDYCFVQHISGYIGWAKIEDFIPCDLENFRQWRQGLRALFRKSVRNSDNKVIIPLGSELPIHDTDKVKLPNGEFLKVDLSLCKVFSKKTPDKAVKMIENALELCGVPYHWGGVSPSGIDCSGFVNIMYRTLGVMIPRDCDQQFIGGELVGWKGYMEDMLPGDLLYFAGANGRITHTGIYAGNQRFLHAHEPFLSFSSFDPTSPEYDEKNAKRWVYAKRVFQVTE